MTNSEIPNELEEAARKYQEGVPVDTTIHYCGADEDVYFANRLVDAVIFGAKWQAERLLSGRPLPEDTILFNKGVEEGKRLMMKDAVKGVFLYTTCPTIELDDWEDYNFKDFDDVRVIVLPKEDLHE